MIWFLFSLCHSEIICWDIYSQTSNYCNYFYGFHGEIQEYTVPVDVAFNTWILLFVLSACLLSCYQTIFSCWSIHFIFYFKSHVCLCICVCVCGGHVCEYRYESRRIRSTTMTIVWSCEPPKVDAGNWTQNLLSSSMCS